MPENGFNSDTKINSTQACFIELNAIGYRLVWASNLLVEHADKIPGFIIPGQALPSDTQRNKYMVRSMHEYLIINLFKLLEIHDSILGRILRENNVIELEKALEGCWKPIDEISDKIRKYRHAIAHSKEQANNYISYVELDPDYLVTIGKIIAAANLAVFYISGLFENLSSLYGNAMEVHNKKIKEIKMWYHKDEIPDIQTKVIEILKITNSRLKEKGFHEAHHIEYADRQENQRS